MFHSDFFKNVFGLRTGIWHFSRKPRYPEELHVLARKNPQFLRIHVGRQKIRKNSTFPEAPGRGVGQERKKVQGPIRPPLGNPMGTVGLIFAIPRRCPWALGA